MDIHDPEVTEALRAKFKLDTAELDDAIKEVELLRVGDGVRALHERDGEGFCRACDYGTHHPCPTIRALDASDMVTFTCPFPGCKYAIAEYSDSEMTDEIIKTAAAAHIVTAHI